MSDSYILSTVDLDEHVVGVQRFGSGPPGPGWYACRGFRTSGAVDLPIGPCEDFAALRIAYRWYQITHAPEYCALPLVEGFEPMWLEAIHAGPLNAAAREVRLFHPLVLTGDLARLFVGRNLRIDSFVKCEIGQGLFLGHDIHVASFCHLGIGGGCTILEDGSSFGSGAKVISGSNIAERGHGCSAIAPDAAIKRSFAHVKKNATLYAGAIVTPGVTVGENAVLAAGAVATKDIPPFEVWAGVPARYLRPV